MKLNFYKMHGCGNDYIFVDRLGLGELRGAEALAKKLSKRHFSVGSDGLVLILPSQVAHAKMRIFNADGSEGAMCGNALRCVAKLLYESGFVKKSRIKIETASGVRDVFLFVKDGKVGAVTASMGEGKVRKGTESHLGLDFHSANVGNEHRVCFVENADALDIEKMGRALTSAEHFGDGANIEFCSLVSENCLRVRVFERGSGLTLACGTGACASALCALDLGLVSTDKSIKIQMDGGTLTVKIDGDGLVFLTGNAEFVFEGVVEI